MAEKQIISNLENINGSGLKFGIVASLYNVEIVDALCQSAETTLKQSGVQSNNIDLLRVPGAYEIPMAAQHMAESEKSYDALLALGCVIRGETEHFEQVVNSCSLGVQRVILDYHIPIAFGVIAVNSLQQAQDRTQGELDRGAEAARAAMMMVQVARTKL